MEKVSKREKEQKEILDRIHGEIDYVFTQAKKYFQELNANDVNILRENLNLFCTNLRRDLWNPLDEYHFEAQRQQEINEIQRHVDQGLRFQFIKSDCATFCLQDTESGPEVVLKRLDTDDIPL